MLRKVTELLDKHDIEYWLEGGTLLGIIRENRLLPWDNDLDISVKEDQLDKINKLLQKRWWLWKRVTRKNRNDPPLVLNTTRLITLYRWKDLLFHHKADIIGIDIFIKTRSSDKFFWACGNVKYTKFSTPAKYYDNLSSVTFNGKSYPIPEDTDGYLTQRYGDWKTPVTTWAFDKDDASIVK